VQDEARSGLLVAETQLWNALPNFMRTVDDALSKIGAEPLPPDSVPFAIGSWIGGDRDGNPFVTAEVTRDIVLLGRWRAADLYYRQVDRLLFELSLTNAADELKHVAASITTNQLWCDALSQGWLKANNAEEVDKLALWFCLINRSKERIHWDFPRGNIPADEPYRRVLAQLRERLLATRDYCEEQLLAAQATEVAGAGVPVDTAGTAHAHYVRVVPSANLVIERTADLLEPLLLCYRSLCACGDELVARGYAVFEQGVYKWACYSAARVRASSPRPRSA